MAIALVEQDNRDIELIVCDLFSHDRRIQKKAIKVLEQRKDPQAALNLTKLLESKDKEIQSMAAKALMACPSEQAIEDLINGLINTEDNVRYWISRALGRIGGTRAVNRLETLIDKPAIASWAVETLGRIGSDAVELLIKLFEHDDWQIRFAASRALIGMGEVGLERILEALKVGGHHMRYWTTRTLGEIRHPASTTQLSACLEDASEDVRHSAVEALLKVGNRASVQAVLAVLEDEREDMRFYAARAFGCIGEEVLEPLVTSLGDSSWSVRSAAAESIGLIGRVSVPALERVLEEEEENARQT